MQKKNTRFFSLMLLALFVCLVSLVDSAFAGKGDSLEDEFIRQNFWSVDRNSNR